MSNLIQTLTRPVRYWYIPLIIGILFSIFGGYIFFIPLETYATLSILFSISFVASGLFDIIFSIQNNKSLSGWGWYLTCGILTFAMGIYLLFFPGVSKTILPFVVGFALLFRSFQLLGFAFDLKELRVLKWGNVAMLSIAGIIFSFILLAHPIFTGISLIVITALSFIFIGISTIMLSLKLKKLKNLPGKLSAELRDKIDALQKEIEEYRSYES